MLEVIFWFLSSENLILKVQNSSGLKDSIWCSLSVINFKATDWTRPADLEPGSLVHNIGDMLKPTKYGTLSYRIFVKLDCSLLRYKDLEIHFYKKSME